MKEIKSAHGSPHFINQHEILLLIATFVALVLIDFFNFPANDYVKTSESFKINSMKKRQSSMYSLKPISFLQRFLIIDLVMVPKSNSFSPMNITTTSHLRTPSSIYNFQLNNLLNSNQSCKVTIFKKNSLINSMLSMNLIFEGNLNEFSSYLIEITHCKEIFGRILISIRFSFFIISVICLIFYNNIKNHHRGHHNFRHIQIILIALSICNFPYLMLLQYRTDYYISHIDNFVFSFYPAFFISYLFYLCFFFNKKIKTLYFVLLIFALYVTNYQIKIHLLSQLCENKQMKSCISIWIQTFVLAFHLLITFLIKYFNKYESDPAVFVFSNGIIIVLILFNLYNLYFEWTKDAFVFEILIIQFFNLATFGLSSMFSSNPSNIANDQLYNVDNYLLDTGSRSVY